MHSPSTPPQNYRVERLRLGRAPIKRGDLIYFTHKNGKAGAGTVLNKSSVHIFGPEQHWKVLNMNSGRHLIVPYNLINSVVNIN